MRTAALGICAAACAIGAASAESVLPQFRGCHDGFINWIKKNPEPEGRALRLVSIDCVEMSSNSFSEVILSPDERAFGHWLWGFSQHIEIVQLGQATSTRVANKVNFRSIASTDTSRNAPKAIAWSADSATLWSVRQDLNPSGFALSGLSPIRVGLDGSIHDLPALRHPAGPLDGIMWIGDKGKALALFGWRGGSYKPEHNDPNPSLAIVDAAKGSVLESLPARAIPTFRETLPAYGVTYSIGGASGVILRDGRVRVVLRMNGWIERPRNGSQKPDDFIKHSGFWLEWTQGEAPQEWRDPYDSLRAMPAVLTPDGSRILVTRELQPKGIRVFDCDDCKVPPPTPVTARIVEMVDLSTRRVLWSVTATAREFWSQGAAPAISADGRYGFIELPPADNRRPLALIDMRDGKVIQTIAPSMIGSYPDSFGFTRSGKGVWVATGNQVRFYEFN